MSTFTKRADTAAARSTTLRSTAPRATAARTAALRSASLRAAALATVLAGALCAGCAQSTAPGAAKSGARVGSQVGALAVPAAVPAASSGTTASPAAAPKPSALPPGIGAAMGAKVPADADQILLVTGKGAHSADSTAVLYQRGSAGQWQADGSWAAHNGLHGWTSDHHDSDLSTPIGVFGLTDAGGRLPDPGSKLPYHQSSQFVVSGTGFEGEPLAGAFDYVIAINYNRIPGTSPLDPTRPEGEDKGGGIWVHLDHAGPTHACVSLPKTALLTLMRTLDPAQHPVIVMGDPAALS